MRWCLRRGVDPVGADLVQVLNFLSSLPLDGLAFHSVNALRSAISAGHAPIGGFLCR